MYKSKGDGEKPVFIEFDLKSRTTDQNALKSIVKTLYGQKTNDLLGFISWNRLKTEQRNVCFRLHLSF